MFKDTHKKIALVTTSLAGGGSERSTALLSKMLDKKGMQVHIILLTDVIDYAYAGTIYNMGLNKKEGDSIIKKTKRFREFKTYLKKENFDLIIDNRNRNNVLKERFYLSFIYKNQKIIYVARSFKLDNYFTKSLRVGAKMIQKSVGIIGVSKAISEEINTTFNTKKAITIYNPIGSFNVTKNVVSEESYFIFAGRLLDDVKNLSLLINAFAKAKKENYLLKIYGEGDDKDVLVQLVQDLNMKEKIRFYPFEKDIHQEIYKAKALLLTSHYEGFPRVIVESLALGRPVISVDCKSGPNEVIINKENGILVENYDESAFTKAIESFIFDNDLYTRCEQNAKESVKHLKMDVIAEQWNDYLKNL